MVRIFPDHKDIYSEYCLIKEWIKEKNRVKKRFSNKEVAERYLKKWSSLERVCATFCYNASTARYHAAKEYLKSNSP